MRSRACAAQEEDAAAEAKAAKARGGSAAQDQPGGRHSRGRNNSQAPAMHWWQDPQAAFGPGDPMANAAAQQRDLGLTNDASKPARPLSGQPGSKHSRCACSYKDKRRILSASSLAVQQFYQAARALQEAGNLESCGPYRMGSASFIGWVRVPARPCLHDGRAPDCIQSGWAVSDILPQHLRREQEEWAPQKQRAKRQQHATRDEATGQTSGGKAAVNRSNTFGSGGSAFRVRPYIAATFTPSPSVGFLIHNGSSASVQPLKPLNIPKGWRFGEMRGGCALTMKWAALQKVAQRPRNFRSLQRADSVGSENSRSRSSIGAAPGRRGHTDAASPPEQLQSAANILAGLSGQRQS